MKSSIFKRITFITIIVLIIPWLFSCKKQKNDSEIFDYTVWGDFALWADRNPSERTPYAVTWSYDSEKECYRLILPSDMSEFYIWLEGTNAARIDGASFKSGHFYAYDNEMHTVTIGNDKAESFDFYFTKTENTASLIASIPQNELEQLFKSNSEYMSPATILITDQKGDSQYYGQLEYITKTSNSIKPSFEFSVAKESLICNMEPSKTWILDSMESDPSLLQKATFTNLAKNMGFTSIPDFQYTDIWINGNYYGLYLICEKTQIQPGRIDISSLHPPVNTKYDNNTYKEDGNIKYCENSTSNDDITGGYLLSVSNINNWNNIKCGFITDNNTVFKIEDISVSKEETEYIRNVLNKAETALSFETDYDLSLLLDEKEIALCQLINYCYYQNNEANIILYIYKNSNSKDGKLHFLPYPIFEKIDLKNKIKTDFLNASKSFSWYDQLTDNTEYQTILKENYNSLLKEKINAIASYINSLDEAIQISKDLDSNLYKTSPYSADTLINYLNQKNNSLNTEINDFFEK